MSQNIYLFNSSGHTNLLGWNHVLQKVK